MNHPVTEQQTPLADLYQQDYYQWLQQTVELLRTRSLDRLDLENLIEEIDEMARREKRSLESNLRVVLVHLLKWKYQPQNRSGSWRGSIAEHRIRIRKALQDSPSLKGYLPEVFPEAYRDAIKIASQETGLNRDTFPSMCEWTLQQSLDEDWLP